MCGNKKDCFQFQDVLGAELETLNGLRREPIVDEADEKKTKEAFQGQNAYSLAHKANLTGIAFSGGGIRSATFNLGVLQALAKVREKHKGVKVGLLSRFDYLSTVSGGGYIGSWLSAWLHRLNKKEAVGEAFLNTVQPRLTTRPCGFGRDKESDECKNASGFDKSPTTSGYPPLEHRAVRHLRRYSNYLAPRLGLSGDTLSMVSLFLRNFVLLQLALITLLATALSVPYFAIALSEDITQTAVGKAAQTMVFGLPLAEVLLGVGLIGLLIVLVGSSRQLARIHGGAVDRATSRRTPTVNALWVTLCTVASWLIVVSGVAIKGVANLTYYLAIGAIAYSLAWWIGYSLHRRRLARASTTYEKLTKGKWIRAVLVPLFVGLVFGLIGWVCGKLLDNPAVVNLDNLPATITIGPPAILLVVSFIVTIHIGTARDLFSEAHREWWARLGGYVLLAGFLWLVLFSVALFAPPLVKWMGNGGLAVLLAWAGSSGIGAWLASNAAPGNGTEEPSTVKPLVISIVPWLFIAGLAFVVAAGIYALIGLALQWSEWPSSFSLDLAFWYSARELVSIETYQALIMLLISAGLFIAITLGLDINIFSAHTMYKNRLVRAYLGASRDDGRPNAEPFTKFDEADDLWLAQLDEQRPIPVMNATLNMTGGDDLAWQTRRAASFTFTPRFVGYEAKSSSGIDLGDYRRTQEYGAGEGESKSGKRNGFKLGTVMAISGAAASPNMGHHTSVGVAALLTAFNMRLGYWAGNPSRKPESRPDDSWTAWRKKGPLMAASPILKELTGSANGESPWVNISDGGHFENLGIYELVRRRCRFIVVTDAGCDPEHRFQDLANAVRKCWTDLGVHIYLPYLKDVALQNQKKSNSSKETRRYSKKHGCVGLIEYPDRKRKEDKERYGIILYLKSSLTRDDVCHFVDIRQYAKEHDRFPHQTTGDQFFDENQFEAYRHLGYCVVDHFRSVIESVFVDNSSKICDTEFRKLVDELRAEQKKFADFADSDP